MGLLPELPIEQKIKLRSGIYSLKGDFKLLFVSVAN